MITTAKQPTDQRTVQIILNQTTRWVELRFPERPHDIILRELKSSGFRWTPDDQAWHRLISDEATAEAMRIARFFVDHQRPHLNA